MRKGQKGFSLIELLIVVLIIGIIAAIAIPNLLSARRAANESTAIAALRVLHSAQMQYKATTGSGIFAGTISANGDLAGLAELANKGFIDNLLGSGTKNGYSFVGAKYNGSSVAEATFFFSCVPIVVSGAAKTGSRNFGISTDGVLHYTAASSTQLTDSTVSSATVFEY